MILMALDANSEHTVLTGNVIRQKKSDLKRVEYDTGHFIKIDPMLPSSSYTFDATDPERIFACHPEYLMNHPSDIVGNSAEIIMLDACGVLKWYGFRRTRKPKEIVCIEKADQWVEFHCRRTFETGSSDYTKRLIPLNKNGVPLTAFFQKSKVCDPMIEGLSLITSCSVIEDAHRSNAMLASVKDATEIKFPVPLNDYKQLFSERDGPYSSGRRKSIIHWVASHLRKKTDGGASVVSKHTRGIQEFVIDGLKIRIEPN